MVFEFFKSRGYVVGSSKRLVFWFRDRVKENAYTGIKLFTFVNLGISALRICSHFFYARYKFIIIIDSFRGPLKNLDKLDK